MKMKPLFASVFLLTATAMSGCAVAAAQTTTPGHSQPAIELGAPFADNAILQRQMPVPVWGWSKPGTRVTVAFAGEQKTATAGEDGKWMLKLDALAASATPLEMVISDATGNKVILKNILVGEVWMASGQSNMQWPVGKSSSSLIVKELVEKARADKGKLPPIREGKVTNVFSSLHPLEHAKGAWSDGSNFSEYSAIAFAFAHELHKELGIPIGILNCAFSTTTIQAWTPREGIECGTDEYTKGLHKKILEGDFRASENKTAWEQYYQEVREWARGNAELYKKGLQLKNVPSVPGNLNGNRDISWMFNAKIHPTIPYAIRGAIWNQGYANTGEGLFYYHNLHSLIRGWRALWGRPDLPVYFHQFYSPGYDDGLSLNSTAEMRLGTWLARDIPHANMASQIDISGSVHYYHKAVPGQRLARHALKNQYGKDIVADGPMFRSYKVEGSKLVVEFDFAEGGLVVGETGTQADPRKGSGFANPTAIENGDDKVTLFHIADASRVWHRARLKIDGDKVILTAPGVPEPRGVAYGCNGVGWLPNLYNRALLPLTPFIYYDHKLVTSGDWPDDPIKVAGAEKDSMSGRRGATLLASQYRDDCVIQAGVPTPFWGDAPGGSIIKLSFAGLERTHTVKPDDHGWQITIPPLPASAEPRTLKVTCERDGQLYVVNEVTNIVVGDVWYVAVPEFDFTAPMETRDRNVRLFTPNAAKRSNPMPYRYKLEIPPKGTRQYAIWRSADELSQNSSLHVLANILGARIQAKTGRPVGIVVMNTQDQDESRISNWIGYHWLAQAPSLMDELKALQTVYPDNPAYFANVESYISDWKTFWQTVPMGVLAARKFEEGQASIHLPRFKSSSSPAAGAFNMLITSFSPGNFKGILCLTPQGFFAEDQGARFGAEFSVMANCWKENFGGEDPHFFHTIPSKELAPQITRPGQIKGRSTALELSHWLTAKRGDKEDMAAVNRQLARFIEDVVTEAYK